MKTTLRQSPVRTPGHSFSCQLSDPLFRQGLPTGLAFCGVALDLSYRVKTDSAITGGGWFVVLLSVPSMNEQNTVGLSRAHSRPFSSQGFVLAVTIIREAVEEIRCYVRDKEMNSQIYSRLTSRGELPGMLRTFITCCRWLWEERPGSGLGTAAQITRGQAQATRTVL